MFVLDEDKRRKGTRSALSLFIRFGRQFNIEVQFVKSVNYTFEQSL